MLIWIFLQRRLGGRPVLTGVLLMGAGLALVIAWTVTGAGLDGVILARFGILLTLSGVVVTVRAVSRGRRQHTTRPPGRGPRSTVNPRQAEAAPAGAGGAATQPCPWPALHHGLAVPSPGAGDEAVLPLGATTSRRAAQAVTVSCICRAPGSLTEDVMDWRQAVFTVNDTTREDRCPSLIVKASEVRGNEVRTVSVWPPGEPVVERECLIPLRALGGDVRPLEPDLDRWLHDLMSERSLAPTPSPSAPTSSTGWNWPAASRERRPMRSSPTPAPSDPPARSWRKRILGRRRG